MKYSHQMIATITSIKLKSPLKLILFFAFVYKIVKQLNNTNCKEFKRKGVWTTFYTMTLWNNEQEMKDFAKSGAHLEPMRRSKEIAKVIKSYTYDTETLPSWQEAKILLNQAKVNKY